MFPVGGGWRQTMAWLHTWTGLLAGWLLLVMCLTGSAAYYRDEISLWMQPAWHAGVAARATADGQREAARFALAHLQHTAPQADSWIIDLPQPRKPYTEISWTSARGQRLGPGAGRPGGNFESAALDGAGQLLPAERATRGGGFFAVFHFTLHYLPVRWGRWITSIATMVMLVALVSGVITHRRFFADFFTFRPGKGQRSWLDAHNALAVLALPYHAMICYSGLATLMLLTMPAAVNQLYPDNRGDFVRAALPQAPPLVAASGRPALLADTGPVLEQAYARWNGGLATRLTVQRPNDAAARYIVQRDEAERLSSERQSLVFDGVAGTVIGGSGAARSSATPSEASPLGAAAAAATASINAASVAAAPASAASTVTASVAAPSVVEPSAAAASADVPSGAAASGAAASAAAASAAAQTRNTLVGLHLGHFADPLLRALLFACGLGACALMGTGVLLWTVKARLRPRPPAGLRLAESLNLVTLAALPAAMAGYFWLNRLLPDTMARRAAAEIDGFFMLWGMLAVAALAWPSRRMWMVQLLLGAALFAALPVLNLVTAPADAHVALLDIGTGMVAATDAGLLLCGALLGWAGWRLRPRVVAP